LRKPQRPGFLLVRRAWHHGVRTLHWGNLYEIAPFYVLIIILMIRPYGLLGTKDIERI
jgi:branched-subunit amino acid ABC-type transport system permease component